MNKRFFKFENDLSIKSILEYLNIPEEIFYTYNSENININDIDSSILVEGLGDAISTTPYFDNQKRKKVAAEIRENFQSSQMDKDG